MKIKYIYWIKIIANGLKLILKNIIGKNIVRYIGKISKYILE